MHSADPVLMAKLRDVLATGPRIVVAVLFGSRAMGRARADSDLDIGIIPCDADLSLGQELALASALSAAGNAEVDLVRLDRDDPLLEREIALHGHCIVEDVRGRFAAWRASALSRSIDFEETIAPHRAAFLRRLAARHP